MSDKYPDGTIIQRYPQWIHPNGPGKGGSFIVNSKEEHDAYLKSVNPLKEDKKPEKKALGW
jgi:hypothetical protein